MYTETASAPAGGSDLQPGPQGHDSQCSEGNGAATAQCHGNMMPPQHTVLALCWHHRSDSR